MTTALKTALFAALKGVTAVKNRVYLTIAPQGVEAPYIVFSQVSPGRGYTHDGATGPHNPRYQVACYAATAKAAQDVADSVVTAMEAWEGYVCFEDGAVDGYEEDVKLFHVITDFIIWYSG
jgi:hypothetical protein